MNQSMDTLLQAALALPPNSRAALAEQLLDSLAEQDQAAVDAAWAEEAKRRLDAFDQGQVKAIAGDEVMRSLSIRRKS